jgi:hypothetical protein
MGSADVDDVVNLLPLAARLSWVDTSHLRVRESRGA